MKRGGGGLGNGLKSDKNIEGYQGMSFDDLAHGLRTPNEAFFHRNPTFGGMGRQFGQIDFGPFGVFLADLLASIWVL